MRPRGKFGSCVLVAALCVFTALPSRADEIRLKDGKKLYGVIVAYEDNMFKVKTDYGYVLVEKDKIAAIIPATLASPKPEAVKKPSEPAKSPTAKPADADAKPGVERPETLSKAAQTAAEKSSDERNGRTVSKAVVAPARAEITAAHNSASATPPANSSSASSPAKSSTDSTPPPAPELPPNREEVQRNTYTNFTHHFRMYKAPSWELIEGARRALPDAIVAMGTSDQSTLMVIGEEKSTASLDAASTTIENRLHDAYEDYRRTAREKTTVAGQPAISINYRGMADEHLWWGKLVVVSRGASTLTILGMTYADSDLIQIQENVITRAISSIDFNVQ